MESAAPDFSKIHSMGPPDVTTDKNRIGVSKEAIKRLQTDNKSLVKIQSSFCITSSQENTSDKQSAVLH